ncbi:myoneurin isoform X2 [Nematostella vectensis]|uniref:myoneurin isoform X2 n=1 Tax=Nematostella vectensis TaxID=45351 RepID=UPI0020771BAD|nr:myoneurin isoform X2 [Nematostella vectensis]
MASCNHGSTVKTVLLYKDGDPVLKVERGTPLTVIKMLYNADPKNKGTVIAALKPHTDDPLPCLVTLDKSTLTQEKYDIIAFEQPKPQRLGEYQLTQPVIAMGPGGHPQGAAIIHTAAGWPPGNTAGITYAPVNQLLQNHMTLPPGHPNMIGKPVLPMTHAMSHVAPIISNALSNGSAGPNVAPAQMGAFSSIIPRKSPLTLKPSTPSRRKRSGHKTAFPRKITLCVPDNVTESPGVNVKKFMYPKSRHDDKEPTEDYNEGAEKPNSSVPCDSTAGSGHENGEIPSPAKDDRGRHGCKSSPMSEHSCNEDHPVYHGHRSDGSSPEHDSSMGESDGRPINIDSDERESFGNDSDTNMPTATQSGIVSLSDNMYRGGGGSDRGGSGEIRVDSDERDSEGDDHVRYNARQGRDDVRFIRSGCRSESEYPHGATVQYPTAIVRLENTVRIKTEPVERGHLDAPDRSEKYSNNGMPASEHEPPGGRDMEAEPSSYLPSSSMRSHEGGAAALHPGTPSLPGTTVLPSGLTPYPPSYPRNGTTEGVAFRCEQCQKEFDTSAALERHRRSHSGERPYKCKICGWGFNLSGNLNQHMAIHQKVKPFKCVYCGKTFARSNVLKAHVRCHTGERPFQCELCGAKFIISHNLKKHLLNRHQVVWEERRWSGKGQS